MYACIHYVSTRMYVCMCMHACMHERTCMYGRMYVRPTIMPYIIYILSDNLSNNILAGNEFCILRMKLCLIGLHV